MIDLSKEYKTRSGYDVKLMGIHDGYVFGIIIFTTATPAPMLWDGENGKCETNIPLYDLLEVNPIVEHSAWVNIYKSGISLYTFADRDAADWEALEDRIDCIEIKYSNK